MSKTGPWEFAKDLAISVLGQDFMVAISLLGAFAIYFIWKTKWTTPRKSILTFVAVALTLALAYPAWLYQKSNQSTMTGNERAVHLREQAIELARELRQFQIKINQEQARLDDFYHRRQITQTDSEARANHEAYIRESSALNDQQVADFGPLCSRADVLKRAILKQVPHEPGDKIFDRFGEMVLESCRLNGAQPVQTAADYLERLARSLPE